MQVILQGSLKHFSPSELLTFLCSRDQSGALDLEATGKRTRIFFAGDKVVWAESSRGADVTDAVLDAFEWTAGTFTLLEEAALPDNARPVELDPAELIEEAKRRATTATYRNTATFRLAEDLSIQQQISLTAEELKLLVRLTSGRSFQELLSELVITRQELTDQLKRLEKLGLLVRLDTADVTAPGDKQLKRPTLVGSLTPDGAPDNIYPLLDGECTIGRAQVNTVPISDGSVSSKHARILRTPDGFVIEDLQSRNGTFVNGEQVKEKQKRVLVDGDLIRLGKVILTFNVAREAKTTDTTQPEVNVRR